MQTVSISKCASLAKIYTTHSANVKDYKLARKSDREFKRIANELVTRKGYIIATDVELRERFGNLVNWKIEKESKKIIWAIMPVYYGKYTRLGFAPIYCPE